MNALKLNASGERLKAECCKAKLKFDFNPLGFEVFGLEVFGFEALGYEVYEAFSFEAFSFEVFDFEAFDLEAFTVLYKKKYIPTSSIYFYFYYRSTSEMVWKWQIYHNCVEY